MEAWKMITLAILCVCQFRSLVIRPLRDVWEEIQFLLQVRDVVWQNVPNAMFDWSVVSVHLQLSSRSLATTVVVLLRSALSYIFMNIVEARPYDGPTLQGNRVIVGLFVVVIAVDIEMELLVGTTLATVYVLLVSLMTCVVRSVAHLKGDLLATQIWLWGIYNLGSAVCAVLLFIHSYLGLSPQTYFMLLLAFPFVEMMIGKPDLYTYVILIAALSIFVWVLGNILSALGLSSEIAPTLGCAFFAIYATMFDVFCRHVNWVHNITR